MQQSDWLDLNDASATEIDGELGFKNGDPVAMEINKSLET